MGDGLQGWIDSYKELQCRIGSMPLSDNDIVIIQTALSTAIEAREINRRNRHMEGLLYSAYDLLADKTMSEAKRKTAALDVLSLGSKGQKNRHKQHIRWSWYQLTEGGGYSSVLGCVIKMQTSETERKRLTAILQTHGTTPVIIRNKRDALTHLARLFFPSYQACYKALQRTGIKDLPPNWPEV